MREILVLGLVALACGGESGKASFDQVGGTGGGGSAALAAGARSSGGSKSDGGSEAGSAGKASHGGAGAAQGGTGGASAAGNSDGGTSSAAAGDGGASGAAHSDAGAGGEGGASTPAPDDTGCVERPSAGDPGDLNKKLPGLDCSSCSNGAELGYSVPSFCAVGKACNGTVDVTKLGHDDLFLLLPPGSAQGADCHPQSCDAAPQPINLSGYIAQLFLDLPANHSVRIETDDQRRVLKRDVPLVKCDDASSCLAYASKSQLVIVVKPNAPRGWAKITVDSDAVCE